MNLIEIILISVIILEIMIVISAIVYYIYVVHKNKQQTKETAKMIEKIKLSSNEYDIDGLISTYKSVS